MKYLVTGAAGFIGYYVSQRLCDLGHQVVGIDNLNDYYDVGLKNARLHQLDRYDCFKFQKLCLSDRSGIEHLFAIEKFDRVIHLAAQAGVRYSIDNPMAYIDANLVGMATILEGCRHNKVKHLVFASSSSVYGLNTKTPFAVNDAVDHPVSLYAATKKSNELMAHTYAHLYDIPVTGLRFFTVYGPWGRPDMAPIKFAKRIVNGEAIDIYNNGNLQRDFTYIDDIVEGIIRVQDVIPQPESGWTPETGSAGTSSAPYRVYNIGHGHPVKLMDFIAGLENALGIEAKKNFMPMQPGDVYTTYADTEDLYQATGYKPSVSIEEGVERFVRWFREYYE
ncbi:MAG: protein CapI [Kangiellaceae bacterium]|nr:protein CapI [Kangiellaceae bacterium]|tara:strand:- start:3121 stop:4125 length:1005 start_codon:yes stop_codon:yes gene_type:complete